MSHLLSLSELHAAAPGVLDVVFGADGEFEGAPEWRASLWARKSEWGETQPHEFINDWAMRDGETQRDCPTFHLRRGTTYYGLYDVALDLRVRSIATRLAGLCAQALGFNADDGWRIVYSEHIGFELITARCTQFCESGGSRESWRFTGVPWRRGLPAIAGCSERWTCEMFLAALTIALAPNIRDLARRES